MAIEVLWVAEVEGSDGVAVNKDADVVVVVADEVVTAHSLRDGNRRWEAIGPDTGGRATVAIDIEGQRALVADAFDDVAAYDLRSGAEVAVSPSDLVVPGEDLPPGYSFDGNQLLRDGVPILRTAGVVGDFGPQVARVHGLTWVVLPLASPISVVDDEGGLVLEIEHDVGECLASSIAVDDDVVALVSSDAMLRAFRVGP